MRRIKQNLKVRIILLKDFKTNRINKRTGEKI